MNTLIFDIKPYVIVKTETSFYACERNQYIAVYDKYVLQYGKNRYCKVKDVKYDTLDLIELCEVMPGQFDLSSKRLKLCFSMVKPALIANA